MKKRTWDRDALAQFVGGVPPWAYFELDRQGLDAIVSRSREEKGRLNTKAELSFIGLAAYFEAFCKNQFAGIINICPKTVANFVEARNTVTVELRDVQKISHRLSNKLGSLLSEKYDFGPARSINGLYWDLLGITPFGSKESERYEQFLNDRNLLVHHGGIYTFKYHGQRLANRPVTDLVHWDSIVIGKGEYRAASTFLREMATKINTTSGAALTGFIKREKVRLSAKKKTAIEYMLKPLASWKREGKSKKF